MDRVTELVKEIQKLGDEDSQDTTLMLSKLMELFSFLQKNVDIPDEALTSMSNDLRIVALSGLIMITVQGIQSGEF
jgi:hypothetical protein